MKEIISSNYSIWIGKNSLSKLNTAPYSKIGVLVDQNTKRDCLSKLPKIEHQIIIKIESGEKNKTLSTCNAIWEKLLQHNFDKNSVLINLGGGTIGDLSGFIASTILRGVNLTFIPTTLLSQVDSSVGGKNGVNSKFVSPSTS